MNYNALLKIAPGEHRNPDAVENVVRYICRYDKKEPLPLYCYGASPSPDTTAACDNIIQAFHDSQKVHKNLPEREVWHLILSFPSSFEPGELNPFRFADDIARLFSLEYPSCYSYHSDTDNPHFHLAVSTSGCTPDVPPLDLPEMNSYIDRIMQLAAAYRITLTLKGEMKDV